ncbi:hypothetical protein FSP39_016814 [Pinctada imbricata]|uniref:Urease accessory protein UreF n=1 Tax=Pinctada imbricata TaxID=66713 RepID=A0AA89BPH1_PINIB|nr:hypothetical protein FSP39_016814 [Pinctada imbricata]
MTTQYYGHVVSYLDAKVAFPTGGFSHSSGLESALRHHGVTNTDELRRFLVCSLENTGSMSLPFVAAAHGSCLDDTKLVALDKITQCCLTNHVANRASARQGCSLLDTSSKAYRIEHLERLADHLPHCHHAVVFGALCGILGIHKIPTLTTFLYNTLRNILAAAVRLDIIGPVQAQVVQTDIQIHIQDIITRNLERKVEEAAVMYPVIDCMQNSHDIMFAKLFYS